VSSVSALHFEPSDDDRVLAGVCGGLATTLGVDATVVRLVFALLTLAGGAGVLLYLALKVYADGRARSGGLLVAGSAAMLLVALGLSLTSVLGFSLIVAGLAIVFVRGGSVRPGGSLPVLGIALLMGGAVVFLGRHHTSPAFVAPGALIGAFALVLGPWVWQLIAERTERIRLEERAEVAARIHDSVLQTLALVQRHAADPTRVVSLARRQERELRRWLYGGGFGTASTLADALTEAAADVEELHGARVELASAGDAPLDDSVAQLVLAAREAMTNAAKFSGTDEISVYTEVDDGAISVFVRDRGTGFDRASVPADRRGLTESIEARMQRAGGTAAIVAAPGEGVEVELGLRRPT
jgi:signal transduction histidine kinase